MSTRHEVRMGASNVPDRVVWACSCGRGGSVVDWRVEAVSDQHIDYETGDTRVDSSRSLDAPWGVA